MADSLAGRLLVATPHIFDPNFSRAVVLVLDHGPDGALGIVLNQPTIELVADHLPQWAGGVTEPAVVFIGGPVANEIAVGIVEDPVPPPEGFIPVLGAVGPFDLGLDPASIVATGRLRVFSGYAGWSAAQLEGELASGGWFVADADPDDVFTIAPDGLWSRVMARQPGRLAFYASFPADLRSN
jgi:putative transcriptional regulator